MLPKVIRLLKPSSPLMDQVRSPPLTQLGTLILELRTTSPQTLVTYLFTLNIKATIKCKLKMDQVCALPILVHPLSKLLHLICLTSQTVYYLYLNWQRITMFIVNFMWMIFFIKDRATWQILLRGRTKDGLYHLPATITTKQVFIGEKASFE